MSAALLLHNVWKSYSAGVRGCSARVWALRGCSLEVRVGERVAIVGRRGAGKTTLLQCIAGERRIDAGLIEIARTVRMLDGNCDITAWGSERTLIMTSCDVAGVYGMVDRIVLLADGRLTPLTRVAVRRVAERGPMETLIRCVDPLADGPLPCRHDAHRIPAPGHCPQPAADPR